MQKYNVWKSLVVGIIVLMLSISVIPAIGNVTETDKENYLDWYPFESTHPFQNNILQYKEIKQSNQIIRTSSLDSGTTEVVSIESDGDSQAPSMVIDNEGTIHVAWCDESEYENASDGGLYDIFYKYKPNDSDWTSTEVVTPEDSIYEFANPSIGVDSSGTVHVAWWIIKNPDKYHHIGYNMKPKNGEWTSTEIVPTDSVNDCEVYLTVDTEDTIHIVWMANVDESSDDVGIFYCNKPNEGVWSDTEMVSTESNRGVWWPAIVADQEGTVHVVWSDNSFYQGAGSDFDTFYKMKPNGGDWSSTEVVSVKTLRHCGIPHLAIGPDGGVHVTWAEGHIIGTSVFYRMKTSDGSWSTTEEITDVCNVYTTRLAVDESGTVHLMFDEGGIYNVIDMSSILYIKKPIDGSWSHVEVVSMESKNGEGLAVIPRFVFLDDSLHVIWVDFYNYSGCGGMDGDIIYRKKPIIDNQPPIKPIINGPTFVKYDSEVEYSISSVDPDGDDVSYCMWQLCNFQPWPNWIYLWTGPFLSGEDHNVNVWFYERGTSYVMAKTMDVHGALSESGTLKVSVPRNRQLPNQFFIRFLERFPNTFPLFRLLIQRIELN